MGTVGHYYWHYLFLTILFLTIVLLPRYRMPKEVCTVVSDLFYHGKLKTGHDRPSTGNPLRNGRSLAWLQCNARETQVGTSFVNQGTALIVANEVQNLLEETEDGIMVICMYKPQVGSC